MSVQDAELACVCRQLGVRNAAHYAETVTPMGRPPTPKEAEVLPRACLEMEDSAAKLRAAMLDLQEAQTDERYGTPTHRRPAYPNCGIYRVVTLRRYSKIWGPLPANHGAGAMNLSNPENATRNIEEAKAITAELRQAIAECEAGQ